MLRRPFARGCSGIGNATRRLAFTDKGHTSDCEVVLGPTGRDGGEFYPVAAEAMIATLRLTKHLDKASLPLLSFDPECDLNFDYGLPLERHGWAERHLTD